METKTFFFAALMTMSFFARSQGLELLDEFEKAVYEKVEIGAAGYVDLFPNQRKSTIQMDLGQLLCLPGDRLALQFNSQGFLSFVAISLKSR